MTKNLKIRCFRNSYAFINFYRSLVLNFDKVSGVGEYRSGNMYDVTGGGGGFWSCLRTVRGCCCRFCCCGWGCVVVPQRRKGPATRLGNVRRRGCCRRSVYGWNGLVFETGRLIVFVEIGLECKGFIASFAIEVFESRMGLHVSTKIGPSKNTRVISCLQNLLLPVSKRFATMCTTIGFVSGVRPHVTLEEPRPWESFSTNIALVAETVGQDVHWQGGHADVHLDEK